MTAVSGRDLGCVCCGEQRGKLDEHHRILGNRTDNRTSNLILLLHDHHMAWHQRHRRAAQHVYHYIVSRLGAREVTTAMPVWYDQPNLGRVGWYLLDDAGDLEGPLPLDAPPTWHWPGVSRG